MNGPTDIPPKDRKTRPDWRTTLALVWALVFGALYARMVIADRLPSIEAKLRR